MKQTTTIMGVLAFGLALLALKTGGPSLLAEGAVIGLRTFLSAAVLLVAAFAVAGLVQVLVQREVVERWLGGEAGARGVWLGAAAGAIIPGGPYVFYPIAAAFIKGGANIGTVIAFVAAKNLWSLSRLPLELALLGGQITWIRFSVTLVFPILLGYAANLVFPKAADGVREWLTGRDRSKGEID